MKATLNQKVVVGLIGLILVFSSFLLFFHLGQKAFWDYDEAFFANVIRNTSQSNDIFILKVDNLPWFTKPPLYYWAGILSERIFKTPELADRIPAATSGLLTIIVVMLIAHVVSKDLRASALAGALLATSAPFIEAARQVRLDVPVTLCILLATLFFLLAKARPAWLLVAGASIGLGVLTKNVIGFFVAPFLFTWSLAHRDFRWLKNKHFWCGILTMIAVLAPWHVYETVKYGSQFWNEYFVYNVLHRFEGDVLGGSVSPLGYLAFFFRYGAPWTSIGLIAFIALLFKKAYKDQVARQALSFLGAAILIVLIFLFAGTRIPYYLTPSYPFFALGIAFASVYIYEQIRPNLKKVMLGLGFLVFTFACFNTVELAFHQYNLYKTNDVISNDEREVGLILAKQPDDLEVKAYIYSYWDTIHYYSGGKQIQQIDLGAPLTKPFFFLVPTPFLETNHFGANIVSHLTELYQGPAATLYRFEP